MNRIERPYVEAEATAGFVDDYLSYLLAAASHEVSVEFHAVVRQHGLRVPEWRILACLASGDARSVSELAQITLYDQPRLTKTLNQMERAGLVRRDADPGDRRRVIVRLTEAGERRVRPLIGLARAHEAAILARFTESERTLLKLILRLLARR